jgi:hypothetical protein
LDSAGFRRATKTPSIPVMAGFFCVRELAPYAIACGNTENIELFR